jgi:hypothetical protein
VQKNSDGSQRPLQDILDAPKGQLEQHCLITRSKKECVVFAIEQTMSPRCCVTAIVDAFALRADHFLEPPSNIDTWHDQRSIVLAPLEYLGRVGNEDHGFHFTIVHASH